MTEHLLKYKKWLEKELYEEMEKPKIYQNYCMVSGLLRAINDIDEIVEHNDYTDIFKSEQYSEGAEEKKFTPEMAYDWTSKMKNEDGTTGAHWTMEQTTAVAEKMGIKFEHISPYCWFATMNMYYSDTSKILNEYHKLQGLTEPTADDYANFCALMAKSFLFDVDSVKPSEKLYFYYKYIVEK